MIGLDVTLKALLSLDTIDAVANIGEAGNMLHKLMTAYGDSEPGGKPMHDVNTDGPAAGATVADTQNRWSNGKINAKVAINIDTQAFEKWFIEQIPVMNQYCEGAI